jgi:hypothetical protein
MLAATGAVLDPNHDYEDETHSILGGVNQYNRAFRVLHPKIQELWQVFYENVVVSNSSIKFETRTKKEKLVLSMSINGYYAEFFLVLKRTLVILQGRLQSLLFLPFRLVTILPLSPPWSRILG